MNPPERNAVPSRSLTHWLDRMAAVRLPLLSPPMALQRMLGSQLSVRDLLELVEADLPLAAEVMLAAGKALSHSGGPLQGLQHAVNLLGIERIQGMVRARREHRLNLDQPAHQAALQAMATSRLACLFTNHWTTWHAGTDPEPLIWTTALLGLARWKLPLAAPHEAAEIERWVAAGQRRATAERELLGITLDQLNQAHLRALGLPLDAGRLLPQVLAEAARFAWTGPIVPEVPAACRQALRQPGLACGIAQGLALSVQDSWYSRRTRTWMGVAAVHLNQPLDRVRAELLQLALFASQETSFTRSLVAPAARLLWAPQCPRRAARPAPIAPPSPVSTEKHRADPGGVEPAALRTRSDGTRPARPTPQATRATGLQPTQSLDRSQDLRTLFSATVQTLEQTLGLRRCALFLKASDSARLNCVFAHGFAGTLLVRGLGLPAESTHLPHRLLQRSAAFLWVRSTQVVAARQQLPEALAPLVLDTGLALAVVDIDGQPRGLWWTDTGSADKPLDAETCAAFQQLARSFGTAFTRLARPAAARPKDSRQAPVAQAA